jgi:hypothetical protein
MFARCASVKFDAYYSVLFFRRRPIGIVLVSHDRTWGEVRYNLERVKIHESPAQFVRSSMGAFASRIENKDVPRRLDLTRFAERTEKFKGDVRLTMPVPISVLSPEDAMARLWKGFVDGVSAGDAEVQAA